MAEISLKEYLARVDNLIKDRASDEAIHHCRHILKYYPKNVAVYRALGRALLQNSRWNDVREIFSRVLSVVPDDGIAHLGLSEVYRHTNHLDDAIWHLERAFEQDPGNEEIVTHLRELYREHRNADYPRVQLTAGAVAKQYARNGLYDQAIDTLHQALAKTPDRVDLRLLLSRMLWDSGYRVDGAEMALEVLRTLPDCLEANLILTELWLSEGRPSDAQRYLSRIEALDPYLALELAQGQPPPDDILRLQELDYERTARRELNTNAPDWLGTLGEANPETAAASTSDWLGSFAEPAAETEIPDFSLEDDELFGTALPDDWLTDAPSVPAQPADEPVTSNVPPPRTRTGKTGLLSTFDLPEPQQDIEEDFPPTDEIAEPIAVAPPDDLFADLPDTIEDSDVEDIPDLFGDLEAVETAPASKRDNADPLAWLHQSGIEVVENAETGSDAALDLDEEFIIQEPDKANPLAWLQGYGDDNLVAEEAESGIVTPEDADDPMAWLHASGVETVDDDVRGEQAVSPTVESAEDEALLDWLADDSLLDEVLHMEALSSEASEDESPVADLFPSSESAAIQEGDMPGENDNEFDWLSEQPADSGESASEEPAGDASLEWLSQSDSEAEPTTETPDWLSEMSPSSEPPQTADTNFEWTSEAEPAADAPDWLAEAAPSSEQPQAADTSFEWAGDAEAVAADAPDWLSEMAPSGEQPEAEAQSADMSFEWMSEAEPAADAPDWLAEAAPSSEQPQAADTSFEWAGDAEAVAADAPDWLSEMAPSGEQPEAEAQSADMSFEWMSEAEPAADAPDWLAEAAPSSEQPQAADTSFEWAGDAEAVAADAPDWLSEMAPSGEQPEAETQSADTGFEWMSETESAEASDTSDWLSAMAPIDAESAAESPDWMSEIAPSDEAEEVEPVAADSPDWLSAVAPSDEQPEAEQPQTGDSSFEWIGEAQATDAPGWLSELTPEDEPEEVEPAPAAETSFEWAGDAEAVATDAPGWLSELAPEDEPEEVEPAPAAETSFEWAGDAEAVAADAPDWLSELAPEDEPEEAEPAPTVDSNFEWASEVEAEAEAVAADAPDWLSELAPEDEPDEAEPAPAAETSFEWAGDAEAVATDAPDWLSELAPADEPEELAADSAQLDWQAAQDEPEWITDIKTQTSENKVVAPEPVTASEFGWLNEMNETEQPSTPEYEPEANGFEEELAPAPAENAPDWLNAMVPGLDVDYEAPEDEPIEQEYIEGTTSRRVEAETTVAEPSPTRDFDWLNEIVEEESLESEQSTRERRRFVFSRQPAWLRRPVEQQDAPVATKQMVDDEPDWLVDADSDDNDDFELPPWLQ